tara:strand:- start:66 stop:1643 length:1578 start_codon:yes stop_codon:yes gene_type:complete
MLKKLLSYNEKILILVIFAFSLLLNQYYANRGAFPIESFAHFDIAYRILEGDKPFEDYWLVSGLSIDYVQAFFFKIFGINFQSYVLQASLFNGLLSILTFYILKHFKLNIYQCFFYSISFGILAYTASGTLYVDQHASLLCLLSIYILIMLFRTERKIHLILLPIVCGIAFFTKPAPSVYVILSIIFIISVYIIDKKKFGWLFYLSGSSFLFLILCLIFLKIQNIQFSSFFEQYILFASSVGKERFADLNFSLKRIVFDFKFIYLAFLPILIVNFIQIKNYRSKEENKKFYYSLSLLLLIISLIFHQINTKNQEFIFFLIPILCAFSNLYLDIFNLKTKRNFSIFLMIFCLFVTVKYHFRFNEERRFHEMSNINFDLSEDAKKIDIKLSGLKWITPLFPNNPKKEIQLINEAIDILKKDKRKKIVLTNYSFLSSVLLENLNSPSRWYIPGGAVYPSEINKHFEKYKKFLIKLINKKNISVIYIIAPVKNQELYRYISSSCFAESNITDILKKLEIKKCDEINKPS